jgi:probable rRNA maturation factor
MIFITSDDEYENSFDAGILEETAVAVLAEQSPEKEVDLTIAIAGDEQLRQLNKQFLGIDATTDVLSFLAEEIDPDSGHNYLGDIIISMPRALNQAENAGHPVQSEIQLLIIHGILHLLGFDHDTPEKKTEMWNRQSFFLDKLAITIQKLPED